MGVAYFAREAKLLLVPTEDAALQRRMHIVDFVSTLIVCENRWISAAHRTEDSVGLCLLERSDRGEQTRAENIVDKVEAYSKFLKSARHQQLVQKCRVGHPTRFRQFITHEFDTMIVNNHYHHDLTLNSQSTTLAFINFQIFLFRGALL